jgi:hypothetical protein
MQGKIALLIMLVLAGCESTSDIDLSKAEPQCAQTCSANYSTCLGRFTFFPIQAQHQCTDALRICAQACPPRQASASPPVAPAQ